MNLLNTFESTIVSKPLPELRPGFVVRVHQKIKDGAKTRTQIFEGMIIAHKHGNGPSGTITVRKMSDGIGIERIFPLNLPTIEKFEVIKGHKVRQAKLYYIREKTARETRKKMKATRVTKTATSASDTSAESAD